MDYQAAWSCQGKHRVRKWIGCVLHSHTHHGECDNGFILREIVSIERCEKEYVLFLRAWILGGHRHQIRRCQKAQWSRIFLQCEALRVSQNLGLMRKE